MRLFCLGIELSFGRMIKLNSKGLVVMMGLGGQGVVVLFEEVNENG
jgi:hypothetical protein